MWDAVRKRIFNGDHAPQTPSTNGAVVGETGNVERPAAVVAPEQAESTESTVVAPEPAESVVFAPEPRREPVEEAPGVSAAAPGVSAAAPDAPDASRTPEVSASDHAPQGLAAEPLVAPDVVAAEQAPPRSPAEPDAASSEGAGATSGAGADATPINGTDSTGTEAASHEGADATPLTLEAVAPVDAEAPPGAGHVDTEAPPATTRQEEVGPSTAPAVEPERRAVDPVAAADSPPMGAESGASMAPTVSEDVSGDASDAAARSGPAMDEPVPPVPPVPGDPGPLSPGAVVAGRYTIDTLVAEGPADGERTYRATDTRSYERCWSCGDLGNSAEARFCQNCGAPIQNHEVTLVEARAPSGLPGEVAHEGLYLRVRPERRRFGVEGVGLEIGSHSAEGPHHPNEDSYWYVIQTLCANSRRQSTAVALFADGMGGYAPGSGLISARIAATAGAYIAGTLGARADAEGTLSEQAIEVVMREGIAAANRMTLDEIARTGDMGSTLVAVVVYGDIAYVANIGDSRAYYIDPRGEATAVTRDQSLVAREMARGGLPDADIYTAPGNNIILHAVGEPDVENAADWYTQPLEPGSLLMLCSDGYWKTMRDAVAPGDALRSNDTLVGAARQMVDTALAHGSDDNTTVLLVAAG